MGVSCISSGSIHDGYIPRTDIEPNPKRFKIERYVGIDNYSLVKIYYPNCTNYEGMKICLYKHPLIEILKTELLDPHFSEKGISPFARFEPTEEGWEAGIKMLYNL